MESSEPHDATICPYCQSDLRRVPGVWLGRGGFECEHCGEFIDFSRELTASDGAGEVDETDAPEVCSQTRHRAEKRS